MPTLFLLASDHLQLAGDFVLQPTKNYLIDTVLGARHRIDSQALPVLEHLQEGITARSLAEVAASHSIPDGSYTNLLTTLNTCGALVRKRTKRVQLTAWRLAMLDSLYGIQYAPIAIRTRLNFKNVAWQCLQACQPLILALLVVDLLVHLTFHLQLAHTLVTSLWSIGVLWMTIVIHELAHAAIIRWYGQPLVLVRRGMYIGLLHGQLSRAIDTLSALAGPAFGILTCLVLAFSSKYPRFIAIVPICFIVSIIQLCSLLPWYADGAAVWTKKSKTESNERL